MVLISHEQAKQHPPPVEENTQSEGSMFKIEHDPSLESLQRKGAMKHLVPDLVAVMEKMTPNEGHIKLTVGPNTPSEKDVMSLYRSARRIFESNPKNKHHFYINVVRDCKKHFKMGVVKRIA